MSDRDHPPGRLSRRDFLAGGVGILGTLAACGDEPLPAGADSAAVDALDDLDAAAAPLDSEVAAPDEISTPDTGLFDTADSLLEEGEATAAERFDPDAYQPAPENLFPIAVWSSDPTADRVTLATRYDGPDALDLVVWRPDAPGGRAGTLVLRRRATVADAGFVAELVDGLAAHAEHRFTFVAADTRSPVARFRTAPADDVAPRVVLGATSCARWELRPFDALARASEAELDAFLLLGDTTYADDSETLPEYRASWGRNLGSSEYRALRASTSIVATWDDHEVDNDWNPETVDPARLAVARQAFFEHTTPRTDTPGRIWRSLRWGRTVEVFVLDCRSERLPSTRTSAEGGQYLSADQLAWLVAGLEASRATFKVIVNSVPITEWPLLFLGAGDRWPGYQAQRERVLEASGKVPGTLWLAGDFHFGAVARIGPPGDRFFSQTEILVGPVAHLNPALAVVELTGDRTQFPFLSGERNYGRLTFDPTSAPPSVTIEHVAADGRVLNTHVLEV